MLYSAKENCEICPYPLSSHLLIKKYPTVVTTTEYHLFIVMKQYQRKHHLATLGLSVQFSVLEIIKIISNHFS